MALKAILRYTTIFETIPSIAYCYNSYAFKVPDFCKIMTSFHNGVKQTGNHYTLFPKVRILDLALSSYKSLVIMVQETLRFKIL